MILKLVVTKIENSLFVPLKVKKIHLPENEKPVKKSLVKFK